MPNSIGQYAGWAPRRLVRLAAICASLTLAQSAAAQTRFAWPDTMVNVSKYAAVDQCLAAEQRIEAGQYALHSRAAWRDTMPPDIQESLRPLAAPVTQASVSCAARFDPRTAKLADFASLMQLFLIANRDADAKALLDRRFSAIQGKTGSERIAVEDSAIRIYLNVQPRRLEPAEQLLITRAKSGGDRLDRLSLYYRLLDVSRDAGDTVRARRAAVWMVALADSLTPAERESEKFTKLGPMGGDLAIFGAVQQIVGIKTLVDSLRHGTMSMVSLMHTMWTKYTKERADAFPLPIGEHAPAITGDFWYPREAAGEKHPAPKHISVVQFVDGSALTGSCLGTGSWDVITDGCVFSFTSLRRLSDRFPGMDVTFVVGTRGNFLYAPPQTPAEEAALYQNWIEPYHIKGAVVAVTTRPFWNLPAPDGRRVDKATSMSTAYSFGKTWQTEGSGFGGKYLIDQDGIIVDVLFNEQASVAFVEALLQREKSGGDRASR